MERRASINQLFGEAPSMRHAFSYEQRRAIREGRDEGECQFLERRNGKHLKCRSTAIDNGRQLEVHHIKPQRTFRQWEEKHGREHPEKDSPENAITLCTYHHQAVVHPDMPEVYRQYRNGNKNAFKELFTRRDKILEEGDTYIEHRHDEQLRATAINRTELKRTQGWIFPQAKGRDAKAPAHT